MILCENCNCMPPVCCCCQRAVERVRGSIWHGTAKLCDECFLTWYDPDGGALAVDQTDPVSIGNFVRRKHGLPAMEGDR